jgi:rubrerythrin
MIDMTDESSAGPSPSERRLYAHLTSHVETERGLLQRYSDIAKETESKAFQYLVNLLVEDEIRHHRLFTQLADSLKDEALAGGKNPSVPYLDFNRADREAVLDATKQLMENEEHDVHELKRLQRELRDVKDTSLWIVLVDLMERDTEKHIAILRFVQNHVRHP